MTRKRFIGIEWELYLFSKHRFLNAPTSWVTWVQVLEKTRTYLKCYLYPVQVSGCNNMSEGWLAQSECDLYQIQIYSSRVHRKVHYSFCKLLFKCYYSRKWPVIKVMKKLESCSYKYGEHCSVCSQDYVFGSARISFVCCE